MHTRSIALSTKYSFSDGKLPCIRAHIVVAAYCILFMSFLMLHGCGGNGGSYGYGDGPPPRDIDVSQIPNAVPKVEPILKAGNKSPYTVLGKTYQVLPSSTGYRERGIASWYGNKFHGRNTSNGEVYDMFAMTAAHKSLPIPCYVKVTNLDNGRAVIVRVNDRGPFHGDRIIDLSYAAAKKLDYSTSGTAHVEVAIINPENYQPNAVQQPSIEFSKQSSLQTPSVTIAAASQPYHLPDNTFLQVGAFTSELAAKDLSERVQELSSYPVKVHQSASNPLFKVLIGPVVDRLKLIDLRQSLEQLGHLSPFVVYE